MEVATINEPKKDQIFNKQLTCYNKMSPISLPPFLELHINGALPLLPDPRELRRREEEHQKKRREPSKTQFNTSE